MRRCSTASRSVSPRGRGRPAISISGGEISQLRDVVSGFDLVGTAVGTVPLDRIIVGRDVRPGDRVIGLASNGLHSNGYTLARRVLFEQAQLSVDDVVPELGCRSARNCCGRPLSMSPRFWSSSSACPIVGALIHITGDGLLNLPRVDAEVGFVLDNLPPPPPIFDLIERRGGVSRAEMFEVYNMGIGFCVVAARDAMSRRRWRSWPDMAGRPGSSGRRSPIRRSRSICRNTG